MFKNINLEGYTLNDEIRKLHEEVDEFIVEILKNNPEEAKKEFWDVIQSGLSCLDKIGIKAEEAEQGYVKHYQKMEQRGNKPRIKPEHKKCKGCAFFSSTVCLFNGDNITGEDKACEFFSEVITNEI